VKLQFLSSRLGVEFIQTLGIPVFLDGNIIDLGIYKLQVAEACSGLRYLFPLASFGFLFAVLYQGPFWHKVILFLSSMPITILMNSLRIGMIGILVNYFGIAQADGFLHWFEGWIIFVACIVLLYIEAIVLQRLVRKPRSTLDLLDLNFVGILTPLRAVPNIFAGKKLITAALLLFISGSVWQLLPERAAPKLERQTFSSFPLKINNWQGVPGPKLDPIIAQVLGADDYLTADYIAAGDQAQVNLFIAYYNSTTDGTGIHSPEICIPGSGWEVLSWQQAKVETGDAAIPAFTVNRAIIQKGGIKRLVYYWFEQRGRRLASEYTTKLITVWDSFTKARADGALVRFVTPLSRGEPESLADKRLTSFLSSFIRIIPDYIPQ
jgi:exosortase D (VPLPA-CTERM-specific)